MSTQARCTRCKRFVKAGQEHCDDCAVRLYAWYLPDEMHWREVHHERVRLAADDPLASPFEYGFPSCVRDPRDFIPDLECVTERERQCWIEACRAAATGDAVDLSGNQHLYYGPPHSHHPHELGNGRLYLPRGGSVTPEERSHEDRRLIADALHHLAGIQRHDPTLTTIWTTAQRRKLADMVTCLSGLHAAAQMKGGE